MAGKCKDAGGAVDAVFTYLRDQNRPYSVNDMVLNLHKEHGKTAIQKALDKLVEDERVREKTYGKQKVYVISQANLPAAAPEELRQMDTTIEQKEKLVKEKEVKLKEVQTELKALNNSMSTEEAQALAAELAKENGELAAKYAKFADNKVQLVDKKDREMIRKERERTLGEWKKRKRMCMGMVNQVLEGWPGSKEELYEQSGLETDEEVGVKVPTS